MASSLISEGLGKVLSAQAYKLGQANYFPEFSFKTGFWASKPVSFSSSASHPARVSGETNVWAHHTRQLGLVAATPSVGWPGKPTSLYSTAVSRRHSSRPHMPGSKCQHEVTACPRYDKLVHIFSANLGPQLCHKQPLIMVPRFIPSTTGKEKVLAPAGQAQRYPWPPPTLLPLFSKEKPRIMHVISVFPQQPRPPHGRSHWGHVNCLAHHWSFLPLSIT